MDERMVLSRCGRAFALLTLIAATAGWPEAGHAADAEPAVVFQGAIPLPSRAEDADGNAVEITGLSGVAWLGDDRYVAVMDNSEHLLLFRLSLTQTGKPIAVESLRVVKLSQRHDYEDVVPCPASVARTMQQEHAGTGGERDDASESCVLVCEEDTPAVRAFSLADGRMLGAVPLPKNLLTRRPNRGLESLAIEPNGRSIWTANEEALANDGPPATVGGGTVVRLTRLQLPVAEQPLPYERLRSRREKPAVAAFQVAYRVEPPHAFLRVFAGQPLSGLVALVALGKGRLLTLERSGAPGLPPFASRIYLVNTAGAVDVSAVERDLAGRKEAVVEKQLLWSDSLGVNLEGLCLGPGLADGNQSLIAIADNGGIGTPNQLVGLALVSPAPAVRPGVLGAVAALVAIAVIVGRLTSP
jgi:Esterase-like activity of phytase